MATSAISTTGLVTVDVGTSFLGFGQLVILLRFQIGGIEYMSLTTYYLTATLGPVDEPRGKVLQTAYGLPEGVRVRGFVRQLLICTAVMELVRATCLTLAFVRRGLPLGGAIWCGLFHAVSSFCRAGFSLNPDSFVQYQGDALVAGTLSVLAVGGSMGFLVASDVWGRLTGQRSVLSVTSKVVFVSFAVLLGLGTALLWTAEPAGVAILKSRLPGEPRVTLAGRPIALERLFVATSTFVSNTSLVFMVTSLLALTESQALESILLEAASALGPRDRGAEHGDHG